MKQINAAQGDVSTHSRPKAAGVNLRMGLRLAVFCFNTQPPEGGWGRQLDGNTLPTMFQHTAARRRLGCVRDGGGQGGRVSTHSRPKAAGASLKSLATSGFASLISLNSQEKQKCEYNTAFSVTPAFTIS